MASEPPVGAGARPLLASRGPRWIWLNLPPARVWLYRRAQADAVARFRGQMKQPKILVFAGSIRTGALSGKLAALAAKETRPRRRRRDPHLARRLSAADLQRRPREGEGRARRTRRKLARLIAAHSGVFIATPEYNHSLPPLLKNTIDWISRPKPDRRHPLPRPGLRPRQHVGRADRRGAGADRPPQGAGDRRAAASSSRRRSRCRWRRTRSTIPASSSTRCREDAEDGLPPPGRFRAAGGLSRSRQRADPGAIRD